MQQPQFQLHGVVYFVTVPPLGSAKNGRHSLTMADSSPQQMQFTSLNDLRKATVDHHRNGDVKIAKDLYRAYLAKAPKDAAMWSNLGALLSLIHI